MKTSEYIASEHERLTQSEDGVYPGEVEDAKGFNKAVWLVVALVAVVAIGLVAGAVAR